MKAAPRVTLVLLVLGCVIMLTSCRNSLVNRFAFYPESMPANAQPPSSSEEISLLTQDGIRLQALWFPAQHSSRAILFLHGNAGHLYYREHDARALASLGSNVLLLSYRGYGKSEGSPSEQGVYLDARAALAFLHQQGFSDDQVFVLGRSLGSAVAIDLAQGHAFAGLILVTPFSSGNDMAREAGLGWISWALNSPFDSMAKLGRVQSPALFIHGDRDSVVPLALGEKLYQAYPVQPKVFRLVPGADHNNLIGVAGPQYWQWIAQFMDEQNP